MKKEIEAWCYDKHLQVNPNIKGYRFIMSLLISVRGGKQPTRELGSIEGSINVAFSTFY